MPINIIDLARYTPNLFEYENLNILGSVNMILSVQLENNWNNSIFHDELETPNLVLNTIDNQLLAVTFLRLTILYSQTIGKNISCEQMSGIVTAKNMIGPSGVIARTINHQQNSASGRFLISTNGLNL